MKDLARLGALLVAVLVLARNLAVGGGGRALTSATYICAVVVLLALTMFREGFATASGVALGVHYALALDYGDVTADLGVPIVAALVVAHMDLLDLGTSLPREPGVDPALLRGRLRHLAIVFAIGLAASSAAVALALVDWPSSSLPRAVGFLGAALVVVIPLGLLRARR